MGTARRLDEASEHGEVRRLDRCRGQRGGHVVRGMGQIAALDRFACDLIVLGGISGLAVVTAGQVASGGYSALMVQLFRRALRTRTGR